MYVLKYNLKKALETEDESVITEAEKQQLRQVESTSRNITRAFYGYAAVDVAATTWWLARKGAGGEASLVQSALWQQGRRARTPTVVTFLAIRVYLMYTLSAELSQRYLADNVSRIISKSSPMRD